MLRSDQNSSNNDTGVVRGLSVIRKSRRRYILIASSMDWLKLTEKCDSGFKRRPWTSGA